MNLNMCFERDIFLSDSLDILLTGPLAFRFPTYFNTCLVLHVLTFSVVHHI
jgi:hypothetical protein